MILSPEVYNKITAVVFTRQEPTVTTVFWARPSNPEGTGFDFFVFDNGSWQSLSQYDNVIIPEVDPYLSAFINDVGFYTVPTGGIPSTDLSEAVQTALIAAGTAYQKPSTGIPSTDLSSAVQASLGKADTAYQKPTSGIPATDLASDVIPDVSGKADKVSSATNGHLASLNGSGNLVDSGINSSNVLTKSNTSGLVRNDGSIDTTEIPTITFIQW